MPPKAGGSQNARMVYGQLLIDTLPLTKAESDGDLDWSYPDLALPLSSASSAARFHSKSLRSIAACLLQ